MVVINIFNDQKKYLYFIFKAITLVGNCFFDNYKIMNRKDYIYEIKKYYLSPWEINEDYLVQLFTKGMFDLTNISFEKVITNIIMPFLTKVDTYNKTGYLSMKKWLYEIKEDIKLLKIKINTLIKYYSELNIDNKEWFLGEINQVQIKMHFNELNNLFTN